jgi:hypothetical protein
MGGSIPVSNGTALLFEPHALTAMAAATTESRARRRIIRASLLPLDVTTGLGPLGADKRLHTSVRAHTMLRHVRPH